MKSQPSKPKVNDTNSGQAIGTRRQTPLTVDRAVGRLKVVTKSVPPPALSGTPNLPAKIILTKICWLKTSGEIPYGDDNSTP